MAVAARESGGGTGKRRRDRLATGCSAEPAIREKTSTLARGRGEWGEGGEMGGTASRWFVSCVSVFACSNDLSEIIPQRGNPRGLSDSQVSGLSRGACAQQMMDA